MSEHQYVAFRAIDGPVSGANLEYMRRQSSRAEVTPWAFDNEYHYGSFRGNTYEMLRRGYDLHLRYANYGTRSLYIRLPQGLPDPRAAKPYFAKESVEFIKDKRGRGGILCIQPFFEADDLDEIWDFDEILNRLGALRAEIIDGDLRPLYLAHLIMACDGNHDPEETREAPVPAGLEKLSSAQSALANLYGLNKALIAAAAQGCPPVPPTNEPGSQHARWLQEQPPAMKDKWLAQLMSDSNSTVRRTILAEFQKSLAAPGWPTVNLKRTIAELQAAENKIQQHLDAARAKKTAREKAKRRARMAADPTPILRETEQLAEQRHSYEKVGKLLTELREALAGTDQATLPELQAQKLRKEHPTLKLLISALRRAGFLAK